MKHINKFTAVIVFAALGLTSCSVFQKPVKHVAGSENVAKVEQQTTSSRRPSTSDKQTNKPNKTTAPSRSETPVMNSSNTSSQLNAIAGEWTIQYVNGQKITGDERPYINFESSTGRFYGSNGCNILNGDFKLEDGNRILFENVISSMKMCDNAPWETLINGAVNQAVSFKLEEKGNEASLSLFGAQAQSPLLVLERHNLDFLNGAWGVVSINGHKVQSQEMKFVIDIPEQKIHGNAGCNILNGSILVDPDTESSIQFYELATTRMTCPDIQEETALLLALEEANSARRLQNGTVALLSKAGKEIVVIKRIPLTDMQEEE